MASDEPTLQIDYLTASRVRITWQLDAALVSRKLEDARRNLAKAVKVNGFRPMDAPWRGKPAKAVKINGFRPSHVPWQRLWQQRRQDIQRAFLDAVIPPLWEGLFAQGQPFPFTPVDRPQFSKLNPQHGQALTISAEVDVMPRLNLPRERYVGILLDVPEVKVVTAGDIEAWIEERCHYWVTFKQAPEGWPVGSGDYVLLRWRERPSGGATEWGQPLQMPLYIHDDHSNRAPGFDDALIGLKMCAGSGHVFSVLGQDGAPVEIEIVAIDDHKLRLLASLPEVVEREGSSSLEELRATVGSRMEAESRLRWLTVVRRAMIEKIILEPFALPARMLEEKARLVEQGARLQAAKSGMRFDDSDNHKRAIHQSAQRLLMEEIVLLEIAESEGLRVAKEDVEQEIIRLATENNEEGDAYGETIEKAGAIPQIERQLLIERAVAWLLENAKITECIMI